MYDEDIALFTPNDFHTDSETDSDQARNCTYNFKGSANVEFSCLVHKVRVTLHRFNLCVYLRGESDENVQFQIVTWKAETHFLDSLNIFCLSFSEKNYFYWLLKPIPCQC